MSRISTRRVTLSFAILSAVSAVAAIAAGGTAPAKTDPAVVGPTSFKSRGMIVDCSEYMLMGKMGHDRIEAQARNIDSGMPACFIADSGDVYLLLEYGAQARTKFQPSESFINADVAVDGVVYERGALKALSISQIKRTGPYTDRESRRPDNPEPTRRLDQTDPKKNPYVPTPSAKPTEPQSPQPK